MNIYSSFVTDDELISPINGYKCKRITRQNIKQFGFDSIELLHEQYPKFPLICEIYYQKVVSASKKGFCSVTQARARLKDQRFAEVIETYYESPKMCLLCGNVVPFDKRRNRFCSRSCANTRQQTDEMNQKRSAKLRKPEKPHIRVKACIKCCCQFFVSSGQSNTKQKLCNECIQTKKTNAIKTCSVCGIDLTVKRGKYCESCAPNISIYRHRASFNFNVYDFPEEFDLILIERYGWYSPNGYKRKNKKPNLSGVSRDHLYSVLDGFENNVDPFLLAHPANCRIMIHNGYGGNNSKNKKSAITLEELMERIVAWDKKYGEETKNRTSREPPDTFTATVLQTTVRKSPHINVKS